MNVLLRLAAIIEAATGLALVAVPSMVIGLLFGGEVTGVGVPVGRVAGIALLALGLACWPGPPRAKGGSPAFRAMLIYNALVALYLGYLGMAGHLAGLLLWPAAALHAVVALLLVWTRRGERRAHAAEGAP
jgi:hypothetical protein